MEKKSTKIVDVCLVGALVIISTLFAYGRFLGDSLRFDEAMEYWISYMNFKDMYGMINSTFQPPVYNVVMHFWLKISESILWFKLSNILFYGIGMIGLFKTVQYVCKSRGSLVIAAVVPVCFSAMVYYNQICGEYVIVLPLLFWLIYSAVKTIKERHWKDFIFFAFLAILSMSTQYGAMFTILGTGLVMLFLFAKQKDFDAIKKLVVVGFVSLVGFMLPLYYFFARNQMSNQGETASNLGIGSIVTGLYNAFEFMIYAWHKDYKGVLNIVLIILGIFCIATIFVVWSKKEQKEKKAEIWWIVGICVITLIGYALGVAIGFYGYGNYASRHTVLVLPAVITATACLLSTVWEESKKNLVVKIAILVAGIFFVGNAFHYVWYQHWNYDQIDTAMETIAGLTEDVPVWIDEWATPTALAYGEEDIERRVEVYLNCIGKGNTEKIGNVIYSGTDDVLKDFGGELPEKCYILVTDKQESLDKISQMREKYEAEGWYAECIHQNTPSIMAAGTQVWYFDKK